MGYCAIIVCILAMVAAAGSAPGTSSSIRYWEETGPASRFPEGLKPMVSPLNAHQEIHYERMLKNHEQPAGLCSSGKIYCDAMEFLKFRSVTPVACTTYTYSYALKPPAELSAVRKSEYFKESQLIDQQPRGGELTVDLRDHRRTTPATRFLPRGLVRQLEETNDATWSLLGIPASSRLAKESTEFAAVCAKAGVVTLDGEEAFCVRSIEDLADRLTRSAIKYGASETWQLVDVSGTYIDKARVLHAELVADTGAGGSAYLSCHSTTSPYARYYCHHMDNTRVYKVTLQSLQSNPAAAHNNIVSAVALCHMDTSQWHPLQPAFSDLKSSPGKTDACHFTNADGLVFVTTNSK